MTVIGGELGNNEEGTKRHLQGRHLQMIAIGGTIGTGLFLKSGDIVRDAGPIGALISYLIAGLSVFCVVMSLGEMATLFPISGSFNAYAERFVDPALGFTSGWTYAIQWIFTLPIEVTAAAGLLMFWFPDVNHWYFVAVISAILLALNLFTVKAYGETEYWLSIIKVLAIIVVIIVGFVIIFRDSLYTFKTYNDPGPFSKDGPLSIFASMVAACFAFGGTELVGITAGEAANPRVAVPKAINGTFWRIMMFYIVSIFLIGTICSGTFLRALSESASSDLMSSPFVIVFQIANIKGADHIMNFIAFIAVFSAGNSSIYAASRSVMALAKTGQAPAFLANTTKSGIPVISVLLVTFIGTAIQAADFVPLGTGPDGNPQTLFNWLINLIGLTIIMTWLIICVTHVRFRKAYLAQGYKLEDLPYRSIVGVYADYVGGVVMVLVMIFSGDTPGQIFFNKPWSTIGFVTNYIGLIMYPLFYFGYKLYTGNWGFVPLDQVDLQSGHLRNHDEEYPIEQQVEKKRNG